jgi:hypothetical protein
LNCGSQEFTQVTTIQEPTIENYQWYDIGGDGGKCNCPDGNSYDHGVKKNEGCSGKDYGCIGGESTKCDGCASPRKCFGKKIICGKSLSTFWSNWGSKYHGAVNSFDQRCTSNNCKNWGWQNLNENWDHKTVSVPGTFSPKGYGGTCKCPDGKTFPAAAIDDSCTSLACEGGTMIDCTTTGDSIWTD